MQFGVRKADAPPIGDGMYLAGFKDGDTLVRPMEEVEDWLQYFQHFYNKQSFPCTGDRMTCPACSSDEDDLKKRSVRYATYMYFVEKKYVAAVSVPKTLADKFTNRFEREGTVTNRDYLIMRSGKGFDTSYDLEREDKYEVDMKELHEKIPNTIQEILRAMYDAQWDKKEEREIVEEDGPIPFDEGEVIKSDVVIDEDEILRMDRDELYDFANENGYKFRSNATRKAMLETILG